MAGKRVKIHTNFQLRKCGGKRSNVVDDNDRISQLPDEILVDILSLMSLKEAARTSVLSSRWISLWKHTPSLDFHTDPSLLEKFYKFYQQEELLKSERRKYVKWVNSAIQSHQALTLKEFRICFHLNKSSRKTITRWLKFAFSRQVQRLELDIKNYSCPTKYYCFPEELLTPKKSSRFHYDPRMFLKSLKALVFESVHVSDGAIEFFLRNCPLLEQLIVHNSNEISKIEVCGSSLKLKHLDLAGCAHLKSVKVVSAPRLTTLIVTTSYEGLLLENVPMLVNISVEVFSDSITIKHLFDVVLSCCISQLETLCLGLYDLCYTSKEMDGELCELPKMPKLKKLVVEYNARGHERLVRLAALIRVSPCLEEFELKFNWCKLPREDREVLDAMIRSPHHHLRVFKFRGYHGGANDVELLSYILENCAALEKMIINPYFIWSDDRLEVEETARKNAEQKLAPQVPQHIDLVIL